MKIALLGAAGSGKTVYLSALYHRFRNVVTWPMMTPQKAKNYQRFEVTNQVGFRISVEDPELEQMLAANAAMLSGRPITEWPDATMFRNIAKLAVTYDFAPIPRTDAYDGGPETARSYKREIEIYDPAGGAFRRNFKEAQQVIDGLLTCDVAIVFLPADILLYSASEGSDIDEDEFASMSGTMSLGPIMEVVKSIHSRLDNNDIYPLCFAISKSDLFSESDIPNEKLVEFIEKLVYERILIPLSRENPKFMICGCTISAVNPETKNFKALNLEWPFLFAGFGTILRNSQTLSVEADKDVVKAEKAESEASALEQKHPFVRFKRWVADGESVGKYRREAYSHVTAARRRISESSDDKALARDIWSSISVEGRQQRGMTVILNGYEVDDPRMGQI